MNRIDFQRLAKLRLKEAEALLAAEFPEGAYYLAGYAVECGLKACIAKRTREHDFPEKKLVIDSHTHDLGKLLDLAGLSDLLKNDVDGNIELKLDWETVREWSEHSRYRLYDQLYDGNPFGGLHDAKLLIDAVESEKGGMLRWIRQSW
ncbi:MAG: DNA-binding protein [Terracidiphilus sp.]|jgi:HEPN domain-containing protein